MRKYIITLIIFALIFLYASCTLLHAQEYGKYKLTISCSEFKNLLPENGDYMFLSVGDLDESKEYYEWKAMLFTEPRYITFPTEYNPFTKILDTYSDKIPKGLRFHEDRISYDSRSDRIFSTKYLHWDSSLPYIQIRDTNYTDNKGFFFVGLEGTFSIELIPLSIKLHYFEGNGTGSEIFENRCLYDIKNITLKATEGFVRATYKWQYKLSDDDRWKDMPSEFYGSSSITFNGLDLFDMEVFLSHIAHRRKILFRVNAITDSARNEKDYKIIALTPTSSAPSVKSTDIIEETCNGSSDAKVILTFHRPLFISGESIVVVIDGKVLGESGKIDLQWNKCTLEGFSAGKHHFQIRGTYKGMPSYSEGDGYNFDITIPPRPPLQHAVAITPIHCHGLQDGAITVSANGGTGNFTTEFRSLGSPTTSTTSTFNDKTTFSNLSPGKYTITVHDSNGCSMKDGQNADVSHTVELTEPSTPVTVTLDESSIQKPRGHNTSDGAFALHAEGGTPKYKIQYFKNSDAISQEPTEIDDGTGYSYLLSGIPRGMYRAVVTDANFDLLAPEHKANPSGCKAELLYNLEAPPQLLASLRETLPVSCHGENDGALTVHAEGGVPGVLPPYTYTWYRVTDGQRTELRTAVDSVAQRLTSGIYLVRVTDGNDISQESELFTLEQPDTLQLTLDKKSPSCSGDHGYIKTLAVGGTPPYSYSWSAEGETASTLTTRTAGEYTVRVTDSRGCGSNGSAVLTAPNAIKATHSLSLPTCHGSANGSIALELSGGKPPYQIRWNDGIADSLARSGLQAGKYIASISDSTHCILRYPVQLEEPDPLHLTLNEPFSLCKGQSRMLTATSNTREASYRWLRNGEEFLETSNQLLVSFSGHYKVVATTPSGCKDSAETDIQLSPVQYALNVTAPSSASASAPIHAVNISHVPADRIEWKLPPEATVVDKSDAELIFSIATPGIYTLTAVAYKDACSTSMSQRIEIVGGSGITLPNGEETPLIKQFFIAPNPTKSRFSVHVELRESMDFTLSLYSAAAIVIARKQFRHTQAQSFEFELRDDAEGLYSVELRVGDERSLLKLIKLKN